VSASIEIGFGGYSGSDLHSAKRLALLKSYGVDVLAVRDKVASHLSRASEQVEGSGGTDEPVGFHPGQLEPLILNAIEAWKAAGTIKGKKITREALANVQDLDDEVQCLRDAQADLTVGNVDGAMLALRRLAGVGEFKGKGYAQVVTKQLRAMFKALDTSAA
jgi:hypothetical protein